MPCQNSVIVVQKSSQIDAFNPLSSCVIQFWELWPAFCWSLGFWEVKSFFAINKKPPFLLATQGLGHSWLHNPIRPPTRLELSPVFSTHDTSMTTTQQQTRDNERYHQHTKGNTIYQTKSKKVGGASPFKPPPQQNSTTNDTKRRQEKKWRRIQPLQHRSKAKKSFSPL